MTSNCQAARPQAPQCGQFQGTPLRRGGQGTGTGRCAGDAAQSKEAGPTQLRCVGLCRPLVPVPLLTSIPHVLCSTCCCQSSGRQPRSSRPSRIPGPTRTSCQGRWGQAGRSAPQPRSQRALPSLRRSQRAIMACRTPGRCCGASPHPWVWQLLYKPLRCSSSTHLDALRGPAATAARANAIERATLTVTGPVHNIMCA